MQENCEIFAISFIFLTFEEKKIKAKKWTKTDDDKDFIRWTMVKNLFKEWFKDNIGPKPPSLKTIIAGFEREFGKDSSGNQIWFKAVKFGNTTSPAYWGDTNY